ncbi:MAG: NAD(P)-dependent glycerol-3-phosphate dehydrogenase [Candidatus Brocadiaceae bacterium]|nr:NAD(P)-dependent glycerol-3-phosphate dehydrogenase [Candidatus Brocadiaceae bacterium]
MDVHPTSARTVVVGCGGWGTALAVLLDAAGRRVTLWGVDADYMRRVAAERANPLYLPGIAIAESIGVSADLAECVPDAHVLVLATPTPYLRTVCTRLAPHLRPEHLLVNVAKGIEESTLLPGSGVIRDVCGPACALAGLYGPSHAEEVARGRPTTVVATSDDLPVAETVQDLFMGPAFRVYTNTDMIGAELGAALKNVIAIAAGICDGLAFGDNAKSALLTRGLAEIARLGVAMGARAETFAGLTGLGDLITTCVSPYGRNRAVGMRLAAGERLDAIVAGMDQVAEGVRTTRSVCALADRHGVDMPISRAVHGVLFDGRDAREAAMELMVRAPRSEHEKEPL